MKNPFLLLAFYAYFLVHEIRDQANLFVAQGEAPPDPGRELFLRRLGASVTLSLMAAFALIYTLHGTGPGEARKRRRRAGGLAGDPDPRPAGGLREQLAAQRGGRTSSNYRGQALRALARGLRGDRRHPDRGIAAGLGRVPTDRADSWHGVVRVRAPATGESTGAAATRGGRGFGPPRPDLSCCTWRPSWRCSRSWRCGCTSGSGAASSASCSRRRAFITGASCTSPWRSGEVTPAVPA